MITREEFDQRFGAFLAPLDAKLAQFTAEYVRQRQEREPEYQATSENLRRDSAEILSFIDQAWKEERGE